MRAIIVLGLGAALPLAACGTPEFALSDEPQTRAAQCAVVSSVAARTATKDVRAALPFDAQLRTLHHALLTGTEAGTHDSAVTAATMEKLAVVEPDITKGKRWETLVPACDAAFPLVKAPAKLPEATADAELGCSVTAQFVIAALKNQTQVYGPELQRLTDMRVKLDNRLGARLARSGRDDADAQKAVRDKALATFVRGGALGPSLDLCVERYG